MKKEILFFGFLVLISLLSACEIKENNERTKEDEVIILNYQPMQCQELPWESWIKESSIRWVKEPTEKDI
ncbi:MAG: hypothetical protein QXR96_03475, partial [Candidatus Woesearchaeota archaeon]